MSFNLMAVRQEIDEHGEVWRCVLEQEEAESYLVDTPQIRNGEYRSQVEMNLSNRNMAMLMDALGLVMTDAGALVDIGGFQNTVARWLTRNIGGCSEEIPARSAANGRWVECGVRAGYLNEKIEKAAGIAKEGRKRGATHILII